MYGWLSVLVIAGFFYFMMRFGCGRHMVYAGRGGHGNGELEGHKAHGLQEKFVDDPVYGMRVDPRQDYSEMYQGQQLRFCSRKCLDQFDQEPQRYLA